MSSKLPITVSWSNGVLTLLDQTKLPHEVIYEEQLTIEQVWRSINTLKVRGAPAIGVAAAYGCLTGLASKISLPIDEFKALFEKQAHYLNTARPTAVNLSRSIEFMLHVATLSQATDSELLYKLLEAEAIAIHHEDIHMNKAIGEHGAALIKDGNSILTHCNAGALACTGIGTALAPIYEAHFVGKRIKVYADETRPLLQGARLTAWELQQTGVDVTLLCDNMAADLMSRGKIDLIITGCDRVALNGDTANKIGTLGLAVLAKHFNIPFYIACPSSTIDFKISDGAGIIIEQRNADEVRGFGGVLFAEKNTPAYNPAFDITPAELITGFITEKGIIKAAKIKDILWK